MKPTYAQPGHPQPGDKRTGEVVFSKQLSEQKKKSRHDAIHASMSFVNCL